MSKRKKILRDVGLFALGALALKTPGWLNYSSASEPTLDDLGFYFLVGVIACITLDGAWVLIKPVWDAFVANARKRARP